MPPSTSLQARIKQFESLENTKRTSPPFAGNRDSRPSYPPVRGIQVASAPSSSIDLLSDPISPGASSYVAIKPTVPYQPRKPRIKSQSPSPSPSPPNLGCDTSLIDLKDWVVENGPTSSTLSPRMTGGTNGWSKPLIAPPLPPRNVSQDSATSSSQSLSSRSSASAVPPKLPQRSSSNSLTVEHIYPPLSKSSSSNRQRQGHVSASSTSSFHSVSLSSDGDVASELNGTDTDSTSSKFIATYPIDRPISNNGTGGERDNVDDAVSINTVSSTGLSSPTLSSTHEWERDFSILNLKTEPQVNYLRRVPPPKLSSFPSGSANMLPASSVYGQKFEPSALRRIPPPPPSRSSKPFASTPSRPSSVSSGPSVSDRSSILSTNTVTTAHTSFSSYAQLFRPTPVPMVARKRYEAVFFANVNAQRRIAVKQLSPTLSPNPSSLSPASPSTPRRGWRGLSVDFVTNPEDNPILSSPSEDDCESSRLDGQVVRGIWANSKLSSEKLREIWSECALPSQNSLDKDGFVKGMWRIDEELRRGQSARLASIPPSIPRKRIGNLLQ